MDTTFNGSGWSGQQSSTEIEPSGKRRKKETGWSGIIRNTERGERVHTDRWEVIEMK